MSAPILELLARGRELVRAEAARTHAAVGYLAQWQHRAADALAADDEGEARQLVQAATLLVGGNGSPEVRKWQHDVGGQHVQDRDALAAAMLRSAAERVQQARELVRQDSVRSRLADQAAELLFTAGAVGGKHGVA